MIAASDPQEFIPSGRRQILRHPGPLEEPQIKRLDSDDVLQKFENVSLDENKQNEWWILRKAPNKLVKFDNSYEEIDEGEECDEKNFNISNYTNNSEYLSESISFKTADTSHRFGKRISDSNVSRLSNKRFSGDISNIKSDNKSSNPLFVPSSETPQKSKFKTKLEIGFKEEELYVKGHTVVWSRGLTTDGPPSDNGRKIICCYTSPFPVQHVLWCTFYCERLCYDNNVYDIQNQGDEPNGKPMPAICLTDTHNIRVFSTKGDDFVLAIPFEIENIWSTKYGILLKRCPNDSVKFYEDNKAMFYSLAYPLDDVCPVAINNTGILQLINNNNLSVVYTNENPSICLLYDSLNKKHLLYRIRKIKSNERLDFEGRIDTTCASSTINRSNRLKSRLSMWENVNCNQLNVPTRPSSVANLHLSAKSHSSMATISRCQSPAMSTTSPWLMKQSKMQNTTKFSDFDRMAISQSFFDCSKSMSYLNAIPKICLDLIWSEECTNNDDFSYPASKAFLCDDLTGHWYFCYILSVKFQMTITPIDFTNPLSIILGTTTRINAKDAAPIPHLHMLAVLEHNSNVTLYSGLTAVGKLHVGGTLVQHTPSPFVKRKLPKFNSPYPKRSSLLPNLGTTDPKFDDHLLSPVLPETGQMKSKTLLKLNAIPIDVEPARAVLNGLIDPIENRLTLKYSDGTCYRITLPSMTTNTLVESCLKTLRVCLPDESATLLLIYWYVTRNSIGNEEVSSEQEWDMFKKFLLDLIGYEFIDNNETKECPITPCAKRQKPSTSESDDDWLYLTKSVYNKLDSFLINTLKIKDLKGEEVKDRSVVLSNTKAVLFSMLKLIHQGLHILYEDLKLNVLRNDELKALAELLSILSYDLGLVKYSIHYWMDYPDLSQIPDDSQISNDIKSLKYNFDETPHNIMEFLYNIILGNQVTPWPYIGSINNRSRDVIQIIGLISKEYNNIDTDNLIKKFDINPLPRDKPKNLNKSTLKVTGTISEQATLLMTKKKITVLDLDTYPVAIYSLFYGILWKCRENPPSGWPAEAYQLLWREDLAAQAKIIEKEKSKDNSMKYEIYPDNQLQETTTTIKTSDTEPIDGMEDLDSPIMKLRFSRDIRVIEVRKMLQSSQPVPITIIHRPDVSDHEFIEEQEKHLYAICTRTLALPTGRGMITLRTATPVITQPLPSPSLCLTGKVPSIGTTVELNHIDTPPNMNLWPLFHNGVANGLRISPNAQNIDNFWIIFNKPKSTGDMSVVEHAGFLMALGLNGHLKSLHVLNTYDYLVKFHEMTSIGILLGLSAAYRGTSDLNLTKTLSIHIEALLPPTSMELDVPQNVQVAALMGIGLVYQGTSHRHMIDVLLSEIGRPPGPEMENSVDRESYSLAAGLALGLVTLKHGGYPSGLSDMNVTDTLHYYMIGGNRRPLTGPQKDKYKVSSFQIREGSTINLDVTAPGATIALGLMYLGTENKAVAGWMAPPETQYLLDFVRPDFLMFRILARALIMWNYIEPSKEWVENQVPATIRKHCMVMPNPNVDIDYEAMNQAYCNIVTGACFALGLKFAGSADEDAFKTLLHFCHLFTKLTVKTIAELAGKPTIETCLNVVLLSIAMVMAGTGNLEIIRLVRHLRRRVGVSSSAVVTYGSHLATHMALGLLFLGGGRYTLSNSPANVAALICAFYPKFPTHSNDNRYHLQAFRHLYVLAVEPRLIIPKDIITGKNTYASLKIIKLDGKVLKMKGPTIIPDLNTLLKVIVDDERYWPVVFERGKNWNLLMKILSTTGQVEIKQRAGCRSYIVDKYGYQSHLARALTQSGIVPWDTSPSSIVSFTFDPAIKLFCDHYLYCDGQQSTSNEYKLKQLMTRTAYEAVIKDKIIIIPVLTTLFKMMQNLKTSPTPFNLWQFKLIATQVLKKPLASNLLSSHEVLALEYEFMDILNKWESELSEPLKGFLSGANLNSFSEDILNKLAIYTSYYDLKYKSGVPRGEFFNILCNSDISVKNIKTILRL